MADIEITQADREAGADMVTKDHLRRAILAGECDDLPSIQRLAAHRLSAKLEAERAIIDWLRNLNEDDNSHNHWKHIALRIECGEHRKAD